MATTMKDLRSPESGVPKPAFSNIRACGLCECKQYHPCWNVGEYDIGRCEECGLVQVLQVVSDETLKRIYGEGFYNGENQYVYKKYMADPESKIEYFGRRLDDLLCQNGISRPGRCLEVGCAHGLFLCAARERGWTVCGTELSTYAAHQARSE